MHKTKTRTTIVFYIITTIVLLPIILFRDYTPANELRYLSIANEAIQNGHIFVFSNHGVPYADKPPLYLWLLMATKMIFGQYYSAVISLFSLVPAFVIIETMAKWSRLEGKQLLAFRSMMFTCGLLLVSALTIRMDVLMCMFIVLALRQFFVLYDTKNFNESLLIPIYLFLGVFTKGALGILIPLTAILFFLIVKGRITDFFKYLGWRTWSILFTLLGLWFFAVYKEGGSEYLNDLVFHQTIDRTVNSFHHAEPFYYYLYMLWPLLLPWSFFIVRFVIKAYRSDKVMDTTICFLVITTLSTIGILSLISSKLSIYFLPVVPFAVALTATEIPLQKPTKWTIWSLAIPCAIFTLTIPALIIALNVSDKLAYLNTPFVWIALVAITGISIFTLMKIRKLPVCDTLFSMSVGIMALVFFAGFSIKEINPYIGYRGLCEKTLELSEKYNTKNIVAYDMYRTESTDVFLGKSPVEVDSEKGGTLNDIKNSIVMMPADDDMAAKLQHSIRVGNNIVGLWK